MSINTAQIYDRMVRTFGVSYASERFQGQFIDALNDVSRDLSSRSFVTVNEVDDIQTDLNLDSKYKAAYIDGIRFYLEQNKEWGLEQDTLTESRYRQRLAAAQTEYFRDNPPLTRNMIDEDEEEADESVDS